MQPNSSHFQDKTEKNALEQIPQLVGKPVEGRDSVPHMLGVHEHLSIDQRTFHLFLRSQSGSTERNLRIICPLAVGLNEICRG